MKRLIMLITGLAVFGDAQAAITETQWHLFLQTYSKQVTKKN